MQISRSTAILTISLMLTTGSFTASAAEPPHQPIFQLTHVAILQPIPMREGAREIFDIIRDMESETVTTPEETGSSAVAISAAPADLWERIRNGFAMAEMDSEEVRNGEDFYVNRPEYVKRIIERSKRYLFHIVEEVERRRMPAEIALLPIIESAFNPKAYSRSHASGIWQFIPSTGKNYGLKQNWWHDDRRDIVAATSAALDYLQNLYSMFGDWELALASYNWGEGAVGRSLIKNRNNGLPADFRNISLPPETQNYVPKLIAIKNIITNPAAFGVELEPVPNQPYFDKVATTRHIDVKLAAKLADISVDEFNALNPAYNRPVINVSGSRILLFPADKVETFTANLKNYDKPLVSWHAYRAKKGETAEKISARYGISVQRMREINDIHGRNRITPGQILLVPHNGHADGADISVMNDKPVEPRMLERNVVYAVKKGDALSGIARRHGVTVAQIKSWNGGVERLLIGQKLILKHTSFEKLPLTSSEQHAIPAKKRM
ncbi:membrane-bound lytic murein transglycosylase D [Nitrosospira sp. Nl5]|uniref:transglycosylase SLT domain-containing protein n=1 Tax=Nitrosospira sp. Nl5 TaxID=200120 RepID=UPI0008911C9F|nr:transglycosylase SLT domain-containing protein [Nitrosospira sp. Nl5]SCY79417.1 membrane-bound lytic murein transglycosylase D [Nitrosospira sp. Nl5]